MIEIRNVKKEYRSGEKSFFALNGVSLEIGEGEFVAITGESGSGKSTVAHIIGGILPYESGEMYFDGRPTSHFDGKDWERYRRDNISFISQNYGILLNSSVLENVVSALRLTGMTKGDARREAKKILQKVELWKLRGRRASKLSSGQKQRLSIARALAKPAPILIADEPTGNLDPENSAKIIALLAEAAKDRLVLLVTHDFQEAQGYATRRISLQDGRVTMDAPLQPAPEPEPLNTARVGKKKALSGYISRLQMAGRPVWGTLVLLFFALTAFAVFAFLGTFIVALDDTNTRVYDDSAFKNGDPTRIVLQRADGQKMTQEDIDVLLKVKHVKAVDPYSFLKDINCYYLEDEHYRTAYTMVNIGSSIAPVYVEESEFEPLNYSIFAQAVPCLPEGTEFLTAGRLPQNMNEVVLQGSEEDLYKTFQVYFQDLKYWSLSHSLNLQVKVVGVTDWGSGIYFHDDIGRMFDNEVLSGGVLFMPDEDIAGAKVRMSPSAAEQYKLEIGDAVTLGPVKVHLEGFHEQDCPWLFQMSRKNFDTLVPPGVIRQVSLTIADYAYTQRVLKAVQEMDYIATSPYQLGSTAQVESLVIERIQTLVICAAVLLVVILLQIIVLRALFASEVENYRLLANIGLTCSTAKRSVLWQILLFTVLGQALGFLALWRGYEMGIEKIVNIVKYLPVELMAVLSAVHLAAALLAAAWVARTVQKQVYPLFTHHSDLALDEEDGEVVV